MEQFNCHYFGGSGSVNQYIKTPDNILRSEPRLTRPGSFDDGNQVTLGPIPVVGNPPNTTCSDISKSYGMY